MLQAPEENRAEIEAIVDAGAFVMGRHMFGPVRGEWSGDWQGWWGPNPPYHRPVFVLTHHPRASLVMEGGTTFHFVTEGIHAALERAREVAGDLPVHIAGGPSTTAAYLAAGLVDELMLQIAPVVIGHGLRPLDGLGTVELEQLSVRATSLVTHVRYRVVRPG
jgi:dihydrofolate reductase